MHCTILPAMLRISDIYIYIYIYICMCVCVCIYTYCLFVFSNSCVFLYLDFIKASYNHTSRSQWLRGLRCRSATARLLRLWVRIPPEAWTFVRCECCVLSGLRRADHSARGVLPTVMRRCVIWKPCE